MAMAADGGKAAATRFSWLHVARCTVAFVVTVAAVVVIVRAVVVMLRPEMLQVKVAGGYVYMDRIDTTPAPGNNVTFHFQLRAYNPSGRTSIEYTNVTVRLIDGGTGASPSAAALITKFPLTETMSVLQQMAHDADVTVGLTQGEDVPLRYVRTLFDAGSVMAEMEMDGLLTSHVVKGIGRKDIPTAYYCWPVTIAVGDSASSLSDYSKDTSCLDKSEAPAFV